MKASLIILLLLLLLLSACEEGGTNGRTKEEEAEWNAQTAPDKHSNSILVELFSEQFTWTARYAGRDNKLGKFDYKLTTDRNHLALLTSETIDDAIDNMVNGEFDGINYLEEQLNNPAVTLSYDEREMMMVDLSRKEKLLRLLHQMKKKHNAEIDRMAFDDIIQKDTLYLCVNKEYEFHFRSKDVIHSAYFPHFRAQMNTVPGMTTRFQFTPETTTKEMRNLKNEEDFNYVLICNKICGSAHYKMIMTVVVLNEDAYDYWEHSTQSQTFQKLYDR